MKHLKKILTGSLLLISFQVLAFPQCNTNQSSVSVIGGGSPDGKTCQCCGPNQKDCSTNPVFGIFSGCQMDNSGKYTCKCA